MEGIPEYCYLGRPCRNPDHAIDGKVLRYKSDNKCVGCRKENRTVYKNCCPLPPKLKQVQTFAQRGYFPDKCVEWWGGFYSNNYGHIGSFDKDYLAHKVSLEAYLGRPIRNGMVVCHQCDNPRCVNPVHLFEGTRSDNMWDCSKKGRFNPNPRRGDSHHGTILKFSDVQKIREKYKPRKYTVKVLAQEFNVSESLISKIVGGKARVDG